MRDAALSAEQLQGKMLQLVRSQGVMEGLRAQLRHRLYSALLTEQPAPPPVPQDHLLPLQVSNWLVHHHLQHLQYHYTLSTFRTEAGLENLALGEKDVLMLLGLNACADSSLLMALVQNLLSYDGQQLYQKLLHPTVDSTNLLFFSTVKNSKVPQQPQEQQEGREQRMAAEEARLERLRAQLAKEEAALQAAQARLQAEVDAQSARLAREKEGLLEDIKGREEGRSLYDSRLTRLDQLEQRLLHQQRMLKEEESRVEQRWLEAEQVRVTLRQVEVDLKTTRAENEMLQRQNRELLERAAQQVDYPVLQSRLELARHQLAGLQRELPARQQMEQRLWELESASSQLHTRWRQAHQSLVGELEQVRESNTLLLAKNELLRKQLGQASERRATTPTVPSYTTKKEPPPIVSDAHRRFQALEKEALALERKLEEFRSKNSWLGSTLLTGMKQGPPQFPIPSSWSPPPISIAPSSDSSPSPHPDLPTFQYLEATDLPAPKTSTPQFLPPHNTLPKLPVYSPPTFLNSNVSASILLREVQQESVAVNPPTATQPGHPNILPTLQEPNTSQAFNLNRQSRLSFSKNISSSVDVLDKGKQISNYNSGTNDLTTDSFFKSDSKIAINTDANIKDFQPILLSEVNREIQRDEEIMAQGSSNINTPTQALEPESLTKPATKSQKQLETFSHSSDIDLTSKQNTRGSEAPPGKLTDNQEFRLRRGSSEAQINEDFNTVNSSRNLVRQPQVPEKSVAIQPNSDSEDGSDQMAAKFLMAGTTSTHYNSDMPQSTKDFSHSNESGKITVSKEHSSETDRISVPKEHPSETGRISVPKEHSSESGRISVPKQHSSGSGKISVPKEHSSESGRISVPKEHSSHDNSHRETATTQKESSKASSLTSSIVRGPTKEVPQRDQIRPPLTREILQPAKPPGKSPLTITSLQKSSASPARSPITRELIQQRGDAKEWLGPTGRQSSDSSVSDDMVSAAKKPSQKRRTPASGDATTNQQPLVKPDDSSSEASLW